MVEKVMWVALGGALGSGGRYLLAIWIQRAAGGGFPWGTFAVNLTGSFLLGLLMQVLPHGTVADQRLHLALTAGLLGGFTTYSTFSFDTARLFQLGAPAAAFWNMAITVAVCLLASFAGLALGALLRA